MRAASTADARILSVSPKTSLSVSRVLFLSSLFSSKITFPSHTYTCAPADVVPGLLLIAATRVSRACAIVSQSRSRAHASAVVLFARRASERATSARVINAFHAASVYLLLARVRHFLALLLSDRTSREESPARLSHLALYPRGDELYNGATIIVCKFTVSRITFTIAEEPSGRRWNCAVLSLSAFFSRRALYSTQLRELERRPYLPTAVSAPSARRFDISIAISATTTRGGIADG